MDERARVFVAAARCADCPDKACVKACPEHIDLNLLFGFIAGLSPQPPSWVADEKQAEVFADDAIEMSFTPWLQ